MEEMKEKIKYGFYNNAAKNILLSLILLFISNTAFSQTLGNSIKKQKVFIIDGLPVLVINPALKTEIPKAIGNLIKVDSLTPAERVLKIDADIDKVSSINLSAGYKLNSSTGIFTIYENNEPVLKFDKGSGNSFMFALSYEKYLTSTVAFEAGFCYDKYFTSMSTGYLIPIINDNYALTNHTAEINLSYAVINIALKYEFVKNFRLITGFYYGFPLKTEYNHMVNLVSDEIIYDGDLREKKFENITLGDVSGRTILSAGLGYRIPFIISNVGLEISGMYLYGLNKIFTNGDLKISSLFFSANFIYPF